MTTAAELLADLRRPWKHGEHVEARGLVLNEKLVLDGLEVRGIDLSGARLTAGLSARGTTFRGLAWFRGASVKADCDLTGALFRNDLRADRLTAGRVVLDGCTLQGVLSLAGADIAALSLRRALVMANMTLENATLAGGIDMTDTEVMGGLWTAGARLGAVDMTGAEVSGRIRMAS